jgi:hypothetical protein
MLRRRDPTRLGPFATVSAWLRLWTPPRGVEVPPVPWVKLAVGGVVALAALVAAFLVVSGEADRSREAEEAREARVEAERRAERGRTLAAEARPRFGRGPADVPEAADASRFDARRALVRRLERLVATDARARAAAGTLSGPILRGTCEEFPRRESGAPPEDDLERSSGRYECLAVTSEINRSTVTSGGAIGYPFRALADFGRGRVAFCRIAGRPGEGFTRTPDLRVPRACGGT